jgi:hypothetical protein
MMMVGMRAFENHDLESLMDNSVIPHLHLALM